MFTNNFRLALKTGLSLAPHGHPGDSTSISFIVNRTGRFTAGADAISSPVDANGNPLEAPLRARGGGDGPGDGPGGGQSGQHPPQLKPVNLP